MRIYKVCGTHDFKLLSIEEDYEYDIDDFQIKSLISQGFYLPNVGLHEPYQHFHIDMDFIGVCNYDFIVSYKNQALGILRDRLINNILDESL
jgi:hypothetical protein